MTPKPHRARLLVPVLAACTLLAPGCGGSSAGRPDGATPDGGMPDADLADRPTGTLALRGTVRTSAGAAIAGARVTMTLAGAYFDETRSDAGGAYAFTAVPAGAFVVGASALEREYLEQPATLVDRDLSVDFLLGAESHPGRWSRIGDTEPERFAGTPSATLMTDGRIFYCHSTLDPVLVDPRTGQKSYPAGSPSSQGCHMTSVLSDGRVIFVGGQDPEDPASFVNAVRTVKTFDTRTLTWTLQPLLNQQRWYPSLVRLADDRMLACGGGQRPDARRTATCELLDPVDMTWTPTGSLLMPTEYSPSALLLTGEVLTTWYPPQLYNLTTGMWRATGNFMQPTRGYPDHSDHSLLVLPGGDALAIGKKLNGTVAATIMVERYHPTTGTWSLASSPAAPRSRAEVVLLPDGKVLVAGGKLEGSVPGVTTNAFGMVALSDLYDPERDSWRALAPMALAREYHALTLLVPDGRVLTTSGTGNQAAGPSPESSIEAFEPPYLFRGIRPQIDALSTTTLRRGQPVTVRVTRTRAPTSLVLIGTMAVTHWMDGGVPRLFRLPFTQDGSDLTSTVPTDALALPAGTYILFALVDDIPSEGRIVRVLP